MCLQLGWFGECRVRFFYGVLPRCSLCPLFEVERAVRDVLGENPPPGMLLEITLGPNLRSLLQGELSLGAERSEPQIPDFVPE